MDVSDALIFAIAAIADGLVLAYLRLRRRGELRERKLMRSLSLYLRRETTVDRRPAYPRRRVA
jgi:hypothetical protein